MFNILWDFILLALCKKHFHKAKSKLKNSKSGLYFCSSNCHNNAQRIGGIQAVLPSHFGAADLSKSYRSLFTGDELVCARCGY